MGAILEHPYTGGGYAAECMCCNRGDAVSTNMYYFPRLKCDFEQQRPCRVDFATSDDGGWIQISFDGVNWIDRIPHKAFHEFRDLVRCRGYEETLGWYIPGIRWQPEAGSNGRMTARRHGGSERYDCVCCARGNAISTNMQHFAKLRDDFLRQQPALVTFTASLDGGWIEVRLDGQNWDDRVPHKVYHEFQVVLKANGYALLDPAHAKISWTPTPGHNHTTACKHNGSEKFARN